MARIHGIENMTREQIADEIGRGGKFVYFQYCISVVIMTFRRSSDVYFIPAGQSALRHHIPFTLLSLVVGWWGIPWGVIYTPGVLLTNFSGGKDVTRTIFDQILPDVF